IKIDKFGRVKSTQLLKDKYKNEDGGYLELFDPSKTLPLEVRFSDTAINNEAFEVAYSASMGEISLQDTPQILTLTQKLSTVTVTKKITFYADGHYDLELSTDKPVEFFITPGHRPEVDESIYLLVRGALIHDSKGILTIVEDGDAEKNEIVTDATIVSSFDRYDASLFYNFDNPVHAIITVGKENNPLPFVKAMQSLKLHGYIGPKDWRLFESIHPDLVNAIEFGWFTFLAKPFFAVMLWINDYVVNWGWTIIFFTLLVKLILFPLSYKGMMSMNKMRDLAPKMKDLKEKYGKDPAKMNQQMMELYKKHGANPMGGCLPMLLQIPVFFALYRVLLNADELQGAPWVAWIVDLSDKDPYFVLPVLMGISMYFQQKITPNTMTDPLQKKIFQWFPAIMTLFFLTFPAGLVLYWLTNNLLSIGQQYYINYAYENYKTKTKNISKGEKKKD
ncbi:MAG: membrane protein insertase YidC, partial [Sulfurovum sp.]|nr:membrane protein insertase YidC [Sulfurovum sp.]